MLGFPIPNLSEISEENNIYTLLIDSMDELDKYILNEKNILITSKDIEKIFAKQNFVHMITIRVTIKNFEKSKKKKFFCSIVEVLYHFLKR